MPPRSDVVAEKGQRRMTGQLQQSGAAAGLVHLPGGIGRIAVDGLEMVRDVAVGEVLELAAQPADRRRRRSPIRARTGRSIARRGDRRGEAGSPDTSRWCESSGPDAT